MIENWREKDLECQKELYNRLFYFLQGNQDAIRFCLDLTFIFHLWDDLYDKDKERTKEEINDAFRVALIEIPANPFYVQYRTSFIPLIMDTILKWQDANELEKKETSTHEKHLAYGLRANFITIFNYCALLIGGLEWIKQIGPDMRRMYEEPLEEFLREVEECQD